MKAIFLEVVEGSNVGARYRVRDGVRMGRTTGEIQIDDVKISSLHAQVVKEGSKGLTLVDRDSQNGLKINGRRVKRVVLLPGVKFQAGKTVFRVLEEETSTAEPELILDDDAKKDWRAILMIEIPMLGTRNFESLTHVAAFRPALQLEIVEGIQMDHQIVLGYGPRRFGSDVLDVELFEPLCPPLAFEILSEDGEAIFRTNYSKLVMLNDDFVTTAPLKEGDEIRIGQTLIRVGFVS